MKVTEIGSSREMIAEEIGRIQNETLNKPAIIIVGEAVWSDLHSHLEGTPKIMIAYIRGLEPQLYGLRVIESEICEKDEFFIY